MIRMSITGWLAAAALAAGGLEFADPLQEFHAAPDATSVTADFAFVNRGTKRVKIRNYDAPCSCMSAQIKGGKLEYEPGEDGVIRAVFDLGNFSGTVDKQVVLWLEGDHAERPSVTLTVRVHIPELVVVEPKTLKWAVGEEPRPKSLSIRIESEQPVRILSVSGSNERFAHELKTVRDGAEYELEVTPQDTTLPGIGVLRIETDCAVARQRVRQAFVVVRKEAGIP